MQETCAAIVLAGGHGRRLGGCDKALVEAADQPLLAHLMQRLRPQAVRIVLSANGEPSRFTAFGLPVVRDAKADAGPLAGIAAGAAFCQKTWLETARVITLPIDAPLIPPDLIDRLDNAARETGGVAVAASAGRIHWASAAWPIAAAAALPESAIDRGIRRVQAAIAAVGYTVVEFGKPSAFINVNTDDDLELLSSCLRLS